VARGCMVREVAWGRAVAWGARLHGVGEQIRALRRFIQPSDQKANTEAATGAHAPSAVRDTSRALVDLAGPPLILERPHLDRGAVVEAAQHVSGVGRPLYAVNLVETAVHLSTACWWWPGAAVVGGCRF